MAAAKITVDDTYDDDGYPIEGGLVDLRLGVIDPGFRCKTCGGRPDECPGHWGYVELVRPVIHPEFAKHIHYILSHTCPNCHRAIEGKPKKCPHCGVELPEIKFTKPYLFTKNGKDMDPIQIREWLETIPDEELKKIGYDPANGRPEWMVLTVLPVPPVSIRPSIILESGERSEDDLTHKLVDIIRANKRLEANINGGSIQMVIEDLWKLLQYHVATYINNELPNFPAAKHRSGRPLKTLAQRLKGKEGRFRYNLSGKRVNFSARTVVSPDPIIEINEVGVPIKMTEVLTVPVHVTEHNLKEAQALIQSTGLPRALYVIRPDGRRLRVTETNREKLLEEVKPGYTVERTIYDGDVVLFNRQPSLHRISMMAHYVRLLPGRTFRLNPTVCPPYNADFDGDEMNLHLLQTEESQAEARLLMDLKNQILSPRHGHSIIYPNEDQVSGIYFLTRDDAYFTREEASRLLALVGITKLPKPNKKGLYSGKDIFSMLLPSTLNCTYISKLGEKVVIRKGKLLQGAVEAKGLKTEILERIVKSKGYDYAKKFLGAVSKISTEVITMAGLSVSLRNYTLSKKAKQEVKKIQEKMVKEIEKLILSYRSGTLEPEPGLSPRETLERRIMQITSRARDEAGKIVEDDLGSTNTAIILAKIGARGSILNAIQMSAMVAQQAVRNKRPHRGFTGRTLSMFKPGDLGALARGFVFSAFSDGLDPREFFHHAMGGRDSLVNTAIRTARSGYMQRRLINAMQDYVVADDLSVRDSSNKIIQFIYGGDGLDPMFSSVAKVSLEPKEDDVDTV